MDKIKDTVVNVAKAVYNSKKVRLAAKALGVTILVVIAELLGLGENIIQMIGNI